MASAPKPGLPYSTHGSHRGNRCDAGAAHRAVVSRRGVLATGHHDPRRSHRRINPASGRTNLQHSRAHQQSSAYFSHSALNKPGPLAYRSPHPRIPSSAGAGPRPNKFLRVRPSRVHRRRINGPSPERRSGRVDTDRPVLFSPPRRRHSPHASKSRTVLGSMGQWRRKHMGNWRRHIARSGRNRRTGSPSRVSVRCVRHMRSVRSWTYIRSA